MTDPLDRELARWTVSPPSAALTAKVLAARPEPWTKRARLWWSGLGLAAALAGAATGTVAAAAVVARHAPVAETAFGAVAED